MVIIILSMNVANPRHRRQQRTRDAIMEAALEIVHEGGPEALSMRALADRIDYSPAAIYEYFSGKDEILASLCDKGYAELAAYMGRVDRSLPVEMYLLQLGLAYIHFALDQPDYFLLMFTTAGEGFTPDSLMAAGSAFRLLLDAIQRGCNEGVFMTRLSFGVMEMAYAAWVAMHGIAMLRTTVLRQYPLDLEAADRQALLNLGRGLSAG